MAEPETKKSVWNAQSFMRNQINQLKKYFTASNDKINEKMTKIQKEIVGESKITVGDQSIKINGVKGEMSDIKLLVNKMTTKMIEFQKTTFEMREEMGNVARRVNNVSSSIEKLIKISKSKSSRTNNNTAPNTRYFLPQTGQKKRFCHRSEILKRLKQKKITLDEAAKQLHMGKDRIVRMAAEIPEEEDEVIDMESFDREEFTKNYTKQRIRNHIILVRL